MKSALITGAAGKIGQLLTLELLRQNFKVRLFLRNRETYNNSILFSSINSIYRNNNPNVELVFGDITDYQSVSAAASGVDYIFHLAALLHITNPPRSMYQKYYDVNVIGTKNIVDAAISSGVKRVVIFSTISVYGKSDKLQNKERAAHFNRNLENNIFYETSPVNPETIYAKTKLLAELNAIKSINELNQIIKMNQCAESSKINPSITILRLASVYGTRITGSYLRLIQAVKTGFFCIPVNEKGLSVYRTLIHENDVVSGAILAAADKNASGKIYNLTDGWIHSLEDIVKAAADALCIKLHILKVPDRIFKIFSNTAGIIASNYSCNESFIKKHLYNYSAKAAYTVDKLMENAAADGQKIQKELGFKPQYDLKQGWYHTVHNLHNCQKSRNPSSGKE